MSKKDCLLEMGCLLFRGFAPLTAMCEGSLYLASPVNRTPACCARRAFKPSSSTGRNSRPWRPVGRDGVASSGVCWQSSLATTNTRHCRCAGRCYVRTCICGCQLVVPSLVLDTTGWLVPAAPPLVAIPHAFDLGGSGPFVWHSRVSGVNKGCVNCVLHYCHAPYYQIKMLVPMARKF